MLPLKSLYLKLLRAGCDVVTAVTGSCLQAKLQQALPAGEAHGSSRLLPEATNYFQPDLKPPQQNSFSHSHNFRWQHTQPQHISPKIAGGPLSGTWLSRGLSDVAPGSEPSAVQPLPWAGQLDTAHPQAPFPVSWVWVGGWVRELHSVPPQAWHQGMVCVQ